MDPNANCSYIKELIENISVPCSELFLVFRPYSIITEFFAQFTLSQECNNPVSQFFLPAFPLSLTSFVSLWPRSPACSPSWKN